MWASPRTKGEKCARAYSCIYVCLFAVCVYAWFGFVYSSVVNRYVNLCVCVVIIWLILWRVICESWCEVVWVTIFINRFFYANNDDINGYS